MQNKVVYGIIIFSVLFVFGAYFLISKTTKPPVAVISYKTTDQEKPKVEVKKTFSDLGTMKISEDKSAEFTIKNIGAKPLQLYGISSSCNCTFAQVIIDGQESELFGMHAVSNLAGEVLPRKEAKIRVTYRPFIMPVYGVVEREVYVSTNDPMKPKLIFSVKANVK